MLPPAYSSFSGLFLGLFVFLFSLLFFHTHLELLVLWGKCHWYFEELDWIWSALGGVVVLTLFLPAHELVTLSIFASCLQFLASVSFYFPNIGLLSP